MEVGRKQLVSPIFYNKSAFLKEQRMNESESETMEKTENSSSTTELALPSLFQWRAFLYYELERIAIRQVFSCMQKLAAGIKYNEEELPWKLLLAEYRLLQNSLLVGTPESKCLTEIYDDVSWTEAIHKHKMSTPKFKKESMLIKGKKSLIPYLNGVLSLRHLARLLLRLYNATNQLQAIKTWHNISYKNTF